MTTVKPVFVVDGDLSSRRGLVRLLSRAGHDAHGFASVKEVLHTFDPDTSGCMVLDAETVGSTGEELQVALKVRGTHLPIIMVSADDHDQNRRTAHDFEAVGLFRKPVDGIALLDAVRWALEPVNRA